MAENSPRPNDPEWYLMGDLKKRRYADAAWIPLRRSISIKEGEYGLAGFVEQFEGVGTVAFPDAVKEGNEYRLSWDDIGLRDTGPYAFEKSYKPCDVYQRNDEEDLGIDLVIVQRIGNGEASVWHLNQDFIIALGLKLEGDVWVLPEEGYVPVARKLRDENGTVHAIEARAEYLKDYLAARHMSLRITSFRQRRAILADASNMPWAKEDIQEEQQDGKFVALVREIHEGGMPFGGKAALFKVFHKEFDDDADAPLLPEGGDNLESERWERSYNGQKLYDVMGELWKNEWLAGGDFSSRVRGDEPKNPLHYITDPSGTTESSVILDDEDIGKWLWFSPSVVDAVLAVRGAKLFWYTRQTGNLELVKHYGVHFGLNDQDLIVAYAYDIAKLPMWQQKIWAAHNVSPSGGISDELAAAQVRSSPAGTYAAEKAIPHLLKEVNEASTKHWGGSLFRGHAAIESILEDIHRFKAVNHDGLLRLAKDIARVTADDLNVAVLNSVAPKTEDKRGSLKTLEAALATIISPDEAHRVVAPLFVSYALRHGDAHLPSSELDKVLETLDIDTNASHIRQGHALLERLADCLHEINEIIRKSSTI